MKLYTYFNKQRTRNDGTFPVYICISRPPKRLYIHTGLFTKNEFEGDLFPKTESNSRAKSKLLSNLYEEIEKVVLENSLASNKELKSLIEVRVFDKSKNSNSLTFLMSEYSKKSKAENTRASFEYAIKKVNEFDKDATLSISPNWLVDFETHLRGNGISDNTINVVMKNVRTVINYAIKNDLTNNYPFKKYSIPKIKSRKRNIDVESLRNIINDKSIKKSHIKYRDLFMLQFYLIGISAKDLLLAKPDCIVNGRFEYDRFKTGKAYSIKVEPEAMEIINKYRGKKLLLYFCEKHENHMNFLKIYNIQLKNIKENLSSYYSRHTWATIASYLEIPVETISASLGHEYGARVTNIYIDFDKKKIDEANRKVIDYVLELS